MTDFAFYSGTYQGALISEEAWPAVCRDADAQMSKYERIYFVTYPQDTSRDMAICAMADALYEYSELRDSGGAVQNVSVGNVSESRGAVSTIDASSNAQAAELYRRASLYVQIHRGVYKCADITQATDS